MDGRWVGEPDESRATRDDFIHPSWLPASLWNQPPMPPCARCGSAFAAHVEGRCPPAESWATPHRPHWPRRHPWYTGAILLVALLGGIGVGTVSVSHVNYNTSNAQACYGYWQLNDGLNAYQLPAAARGWRSLQVAAPKITDPTLSVSVQVFDEEMESDLPDTQTSSIALQSACNALGYSNPAP